MELSKIVCPRSKQFGLANGGREGDQWPQQRLVKMDGIRLWRTSGTLGRCHHVFVLLFFFLF